MERLWRHFIKHAPRSIHICIRYGGLSTFFHVNIYKDFNHIVIWSHFVILFLGLDWANELHSYSTKRETRVTAKISRRDDILEMFFNVLTNIRIFAGEGCCRGARPRLRRHWIPTQVECGRNSHYAKGSYFIHSIVYMSCGADELSLTRKASFTRRISCSADI